MFSLLLIGQGVSAMKPGPFDNVDIRDPATRVRILSVQGKERPFANGKTTVLSAQGKSLWTLSEFIGHKEPRLSPDAEYLALIGNACFGDQLQLVSSEEVVHIYKAGVSIKQIELGEVINEDPETLAARLKLGVKGGGWVARREFIPAIEVDWTARTVRFTLYNHETKTVTF